MASLVDRVLNRDAIENRKAFLQLFFCQRAARFAAWWSEDLDGGRRRAYLLECGVPLKATPQSERRATFPPDFNVETLLERVDIDDDAGARARAFRRRPLRTLAFP